MIGLRITNPHYSNMKMPDPDPSVRDWPKWVYMKGYPGVLARDAAHEAELLARPEKEDAKPVSTQVPAPPASAPVTTKPGIVLAGPNDEKTMLLRIAEEQSIRVDKRWSLARLRGTIEKATAHLNDK